MKRSSSSGLRDVDNDERAQLSGTAKKKVHMQYRSVEASFESDDISAGHENDYDGDMLDWDYDNDNWDDDSRSSADSALVAEVTEGFVQQSLDDTPVRATGNETPMSVDSVCTSPDLVDLTNTPSVPRAGDKTSAADVIDLSESP